MQRITLSIEDRLAQDFDALAAGRGYQSRSEAVRDVLRQAVAVDLIDRAEGDCVANLSYVYNHHERDMAARLMALQHDHHDLVLAAAHIHLDHDNCLETLMLRGPTLRIRAVADEIRAERGVRHAILNVIPVVAEPGHGHDSEHGHGEGHEHAHTPHLSPR